jgi:peptidoglycan/xylan/chitin deacetylase (PgdA/CDA1 family)
LSKILRQISNLAPKSIKRLLKRACVPGSIAKRLRVNFIVTFHSVPPQESACFEAIVRYLARNFKVVGLAELVAQIQNDSPTREDGLVAITFDDGLKNHAQVAYPILKKMGIPASFYLCPELVGRKCSIWTWEVKSRLDRLSENSRQYFFELAGVRGETQQIVNWMKTIPVERREQIEMQISDCTPDFEFTEDERNRFELMSWQQVRELDPSLITIGSHTSTHIDLPQAKPGRLEEELATSKEILEARLNRKVEHLAYPNGNFTLEMLPLVARYYRTAMITRQGVVKRGDNLLTLRRIHADLNLAKFSWDLVLNALESRA